ncbi:MAG: pirin family protein [Chitinophagaceae bacterium]|nr:pirin family protein [Chitinophagaceae bacterium]
MEKEITKTYGGINVKVGHLLVNRLLPNKYIKSVGPFVFLDHLYPTLQQPKTHKPANGDFAHPHRGISTFTYVFSGEMEHFDSHGNHGIAGAGGAHWMNAGSGIQHDDRIPPLFQQAGGLLHVLQFWINLPAKNKKDEPEYMNIQPADISELLLPDDAGKLRILIGNFGVSSSPVKSSSRQFIYHIRLNPKSAFTLQTKINFEYAAFVPTDEVKINNIFFGKSELIIFEQDEHDIVLTNYNISEVDIVIFGGEPYTEAIVAEGPFVMNSGSEICDAYRDFHLGKYGKINYLIKEINKN